MKLKLILIFSFALMMLFSIYFLTFLHQNKKQAETLNNWVIHTHVVIEQINGLNTLITELESQDRGYVITNNSEFRKDLNSHKVNVFSQVTALKELTADNKTQQKNLETLLQAISKKIEFQNSVFTALEKSQSAALHMIAQPAGRSLYAEIKNILAAMLDEENRLLKHRSARYQQALRERFTTSVTLEFFGLIILGIAFWRIYVEVRNRKIAQDKAAKSEAKYKGLIENSSLIIFTTDLHGHFTYISNKGLEFSGYKMEELIGKPFYLLIPDSQKKDIARFYLNQYKDFTKDLAEEFEIITKNNEIKVIQLSAVLVEEKGKAVGFQSIAKDITEVKYVESLIKESKVKLQQQQEENNFRLQSVINNIPLVLYIKDLKGNYVMVNKKFYEISGFSEETVIGQTNLEIHKDEKKIKFYEDVDMRVVQTGKPVEFEEVLTTAIGLRNLLVTKFPLFDKNNEIFAISGVAKDITDMVLHREQLIEARLKAEKAEQLQEAFLANMSHEIRTPMNGIMGMTNVLLDTDLNDEQKEYAELIKKSSETLLILINDILDLSKIKAGRMELEAIDFDLKEAVQNILLPMKLSVKKDVVLKCSIDDAIPGLVKGDSHKLFQILNNLLSNAVKFTEKGEIKVEVNVIEKNDEKIYINFDVSDSGIGISAEYLDSIFESFTQAGSDTVRRFGGTGLGLAITKRLVELQSGHIQVESTLGAGTVFHVEIPYLPADTIPAVQKVTNNIDDEKAGIENKKILIVEDNVVNQRVLTSVLQKLKVQWEIANNGKEAVDMLAGKNDYDLIIMDLQMPVMSGFQAAEYIRKKLKINTPIIAMTASTLRNEKVQCLKIGMNDYLSKPFAPNELIKRIHKLINSGEIKEKQMKQEQLPAEKLYDLAYLYDLDDNDYVMEMIELFFESASAILEEIQDNIKTKDWDAIGKAAHKLKSSLGALQITKMISTASAIEENAKKKNNFDEIVYQNKELHNQYNTVKPLIEAELVKAKKISNGFVPS